MSLAKLFYLKETFRENVRRWRQACFRQRLKASSIPKRSSRFQLEALEPRVLLSATPTDLTAPEQVVLEPTSVTVPSGTLPNLDIDLNGQADALSDGIVIIRHLFGFTGDALTNGVVDPAGQRTDPTAIANYLESIRSALDVDLNQNADALSDGIVIIRSLFGFTGNALTDGVVDPGGQRTDPAVIATFLDSMNPQRELIAPQMTAGLQQDTGLSATDAITFNPTITGTVADINPIASFTAGFDATPVGSFTDVLADLQGTGVFTLTTTRVNQLAGGTLSDGIHTLHLRIADALGNLTTQDRTFILDTQAPVTPTFDLAVTSDTGTLGDQQTTATIVTLKGQTDPTTAIQILGPGTSTLSNGTGTFQLPDLALAVGANAFTLKASDVAGNQSDFSRVITRLAATQQADVVLTWNQTMLEAIRLDAAVPPMASRGMAMVSLAMYDAINAIEGTPGYYVSLPAQPGTDPTAAAAAAAHRVLSYLYPGQQALFDAQLAASLAPVPDGPGKTNGLTLGQTIAAAIIAIRATDGWNDFVDYVPGSEPGQWQETAPMYDVALLPQWADLTPFALTSSDQFRPAGPPALDSAAYAAAVNEVKALGSATNSTRTADQTQIARFWADGAGTYTPPGHWEQIAQQIALQQGNSLSANARLFAELNVALADAAITAWNTKYDYNFWRPVTAIQQADLDGNALTMADPTWSSLLITPPFPEYISGHSTFSGAAAEILTSLFGSNVAFSTTSLGLPGITRTFTSLEQAAQEAGRSRIYGGIHFEFSNQDGLAVGKSLADFVLNRFTVTTDTQGPKIVLDPATTKPVTKTNQTIQGQVLDNLAGVAALQANLDNGIFAPVEFDSTGHLSLPTTLLLDGTQDGVHTLTFQATDHQSNVSTLLVNFTLDTTAPVITLTSPTDTATLTVDSRLNGTADATGSKLTELCYQFDNGTLIPVSFDPTTGSFDKALDLSKLAVGSHTLSLRAQDQAGNVATVTRSVSLAAPIPLTILEVTPATGASDVGTTFRPQVFFSRPINTATLNANNFYATDTTGTKLAATIVPSQDGTFAWLFFTNPMPGASTITIHVDGTTILAARDGQALDANGDGTPGGTFTSTFSTVSLVPLAGTTLSGKVVDPGPDLKLMTFDDIRVGPDGILHTNDDVFLSPIAGAKVFIVGLENQAVFTDAQGNFSFSAVPSGDIKLAIDGRTATNTPAGFYFPEMVMDLEIEVGQANTVMGTMGTREKKAAHLTRPEVYLPRLQTAILQTVSNTQTTMVGVDAASAPNLTQQQREFLTLEVQPGNLVNANGNPIANGQIGISTIPAELVRDMLPPGLLQHTFDITIQAPEAAAFTTPLQMTFPNVFNAAPGTKLNFLSFDHTTGRLVIEGTATVSADGLSVITDPGTGITKPGWHGLTPPGNEQKTKTNDKPDKPEEPPKTPGTVTIDASFNLDLILAVDVRAKLGLEFGSSITGSIPYTYFLDSGALHFPSGGLRKNISFSNTFPNISKLLAYAIPELNNARIFTLVGKFDITGQILFQVKVTGTGGSPLAKADVKSAENIVAVASFQLDFPFASTFPAGVGNWITQKWSTPELPIVGPPSIDVKGIPVTLPFAPPGDFTTPFGPIIQVSVGPAFTASGFLTIHKTEITSSSFASTSVSEAEETLLPFDDILLIDSTGFNADPRNYYRYKLSNGQEIAGRSDAFGAYDVFLPDNTDYNLTIWSPSTNRYAIATGHSGPSGQPTNQNVELLRRAVVDNDSDGLPDIAEYVLGTDLYVGDSDGDLIPDAEEVRNGTDPLNGKGTATGVIATAALKGETKEVKLEGSTLTSEGQFAYAATGSFGLAIVDASQALKPIVLSQLDLPGDATDVSVDTRLGIAVVASNAGGLHFIDVSTPTAPTLIRTISTTPSQVEVFDGFAYVTVGGELRSYNLLTGDLVQTVSLSNGSLVGLAREGNTLYTTDNLRVLRATTVVAGELTSHGSLALPLAQTPGKIFVGNGIAYVGATDARNQGFVTVNVNNLDNLGLLSGVDAPNIAGQALAANGSGLLITAGNIITQTQSLNAIDVIDVTDPTNTGAFLTRFILPAAPHSVAIGAGIAFVADGIGGLQVVNYRPFDNQGVAPTVAVTSPIIDLDPVTPGIQVTEGTTIPLQVIANDDVQVRNVELIVNDVVVSNDVSFPFELSALAFGAGTSTATTVQVRATDTGGNVGLSNVLTFELVPDTFGPTLVSSNVPSGALKDKTFRTIQLEFSEALDPATVTAQNFQLLGPTSQVIAPLTVQLLGSGKVVQLTYAPLELGVHQLVVKSASVSDRVGNSMGTQDFVTSFEIVSLPIAVANPIPPLGSMVYGQVLAGQLDGAGDVESFTLTLDAGQLVTVGLVPDSGSLRTKLELLDAQGNVLGGAEASELGGAVALEAIPVPTAGLYTLRVQSVVGQGGFRGNLYLNALLETELYDGTANNSLATAIALAPSTMALQGAATRMAVIGNADGNDDYYRVELTQGETSFFVLNPLAGGEVTLALLDASGALLGIASQGAIGNLHTIAPFIAPTTGTYYLRASGLANVNPVTGLPNYQLIATRNSAFDFELTNQAIVLTGHVVGSVGTRFLPQVGVSIPDTDDTFIIAVNIGDVLQITTATPGDGAGDPLNTLDPNLTLINPVNGAVLAFDANSGPDGRNAVINAVAPLTGNLVVRVGAFSGGGDYTLRVTGATGPTPAGATFDVGASLLTNGTDVGVTIPTGSLLLSSVQAGEVTVNGISAGTMSIVNGNIQFLVSGVPVSGSYTVQVAAGSFMSWLGGTNATYQQTFTGDRVAPTVTASSINALTVLEPPAPGMFTPLDVIFTFSEAIDQTTLTPDDVQLRFGIASEGLDSDTFIASSVVYNPGLNQLTAQFLTGFPTSDLMTLRLVSGPTGIHDLAGNPLNGSPNFPFPSGQGDPFGDNYVVEFGVTNSPPSFEPFEPDPPFGAFLYFPNDGIGTLSVSGETDIWTVDLNAGQSMGVGLSATANVQVQLRVVDPNGTALGTASSDRAGKSVAIAHIPIATAGIYQIQVTSLSGVGAYNVGFGLNSAFDVELPIIDSGLRNNTIATAQDISASAIPLEGAASRLAVQGHVSSLADADTYSFQLAAGPAATVVLNNLDFIETPPILELLNASGERLATGVLFADGTVRIADYVPVQSGAYFVRVMSLGGDSDYNLVVTLGAAFEQPGPDVVPQDISVSGQVVGALEKQGLGAVGAIRVAVLGGPGAVPLVDQLNDDTVFDFDAVAVTDADIDTFEELENYDVVVIGDPLSRSQLQGAVDEALQQWWFAGGGGLVGTGGLIAAAGPIGGGTLFGLDSIIPVNLNAAGTQASNPTLLIEPHPHETTLGLSTFALTGNMELPTGAVDQEATVLGSVNGTPGVVVGGLLAGGAGPSPRSAYVGAMYFDEAPTSLRSGSADRLLEQTIAWASHVDTLDRYSINANVSDQLVIKTTTPLDGPHLPQNLLDPRVELLNPLGVIVASNDNGASDGKNALINYTVPAGAGGQYTVRVRGNQSGEYTLSVTGATGTASASTGSSVSTTSVPDTSFNGSLAYIQQSWVKDFVTTTADSTSEDEELLIALPA